MPKFFDRLMHAWNAFNGRDRPVQYTDYGPSYSMRPDKRRGRPGNERSIINAIYNRIALDASAIEMHHVHVDNNGNFVDIVNDGLESLMNLEANIDQTSRAYFQDLVISMFDEGSVAELPVETDLDPNSTTGFDIKSLRTAKILEWRPQHVRLRAYDERDGQQKEVIVPKKIVSIIENPFYAVMNEPNSTYRRLIEKLNIMDFIDQQSGSGKMDLIIQLPYVVRTEAKKAEAERRRKELETQLNTSKYGIAYSDGTEKIIQLNRPITNNLMDQIEYYMNLLHSQLGITPEIMNGTADEKTMLNYYDRTIEPILAAVAAERKRKFLSKTARSKGESIKYFRNPFKLTPVSNLAEIADKMTRNEILSPNEIRAIMGYIPSDDERADKLQNRNLRVTNEEVMDAPEAPEAGKVQVEEVID